MSQVIKLVRLLLVMTATNAISETSFSAMHAPHKDILEVNHACSKAVSMLQWFCTFIRF